MEATSGHLVQSKKVAVRVPAAERKRAKFLRELAAGKPVVKAAESAKLARQTLYDWRRNDPEFAAAWDKAWEDSADVLEAELDRRAHAGPDDPMSGTLLIFSLKGRRPERYRDNVKHEIQQHVSITVEDARDALDQRLARIIEHREQRAIDGTARALPPGSVS